ncbi:hypothetical protein [Salibacter halophilus]|uniref:hypothetical protein n=1 Tax=Salibacter halophilus TaxID=1803916 RepID=UPI001CB8C98D|nr:hypothetical protein [Salibacter halophilus]
MEIRDLTIKGEFEGDEKLEKRIDNFQDYLNLINSRDLDEEVVNSINSSIDELNQFIGTKRGYKNKLVKVRSKIVRLVEKQAKLVPQNYYRKLWLALGMSVFGMPIGVVFGTSFGSMAYLGVGLPIGMAVGIAVGASMDKRALQEGRQLDIEIFS